jgi:hypothetical protein
MATILALQPGMSRKALKADLAAVKVWSMTITPLAPPQISGDLASVVCRRRVSQKFLDGTQKEPLETTVTYSLRKQGSGWVIDGIK